ncbi:MAG: glycoside hydrolase family 3 protein [Phototrophicaceae bacterium]
MKPVHLLLLAILIGLLGGRSSFALEDESALVESLIQEMTLAQKVGQLFMVGLYGTEMTEDARDFITRYQPGSVVLFEYNVGTVASITQLVNDWQRTILSVGEVPLLVAVDQEGGRINTLEESPFTQFPAPMLLTATRNHNLTFEVGRATALELSAVGVHMNLAPIADLETNRRNSVMFRRSFGSDPQIVAPTLSAYIQGLQSEGVMATLKHFPGHGDTSADSHVELPIITKNMDALRQTELQPFMAGIDADVGAIMMGHLWLTELDPTDDVPASLSQAVVGGVLRNELGFDGLVMTDALDMDAIDTRYTLSEATLLAIQAGVDIITVGPHVGTKTIATAIEDLARSVEQGEVSVQRIDESVRRILSAKVRYGVMDWQAHTPEHAQALLEQSPGGALLKPLFDEGTTIVYDDYNLLNQAQDPQSQVLLIYPFERLESVRYCQAHRPSTWIVGHSIPPSATQLEEIARVSPMADVIITFTQNALLMPDQAILPNTLPNEKTIVVAYWSPYDLDAFERRPGAYLTSYTPDHIAFDSICGIIFGAYPARGQLPIHLGSDLLAGTGVIRLGGMQNMLQ